MSVSKFFEKMIGLQKQRSQQKQNSYRELVAAIATGKEPNLAEVERLLTEFGMSLDDLKQDVEVYQTRMALKALVATLPKIDQETALVQQKIAAADRELEAAEQRYEDTTAPLYGRLREINEVRKEISQARQELFNTCDSPELDEEYEQVESEMEAFAKVNQELESQAAYVEGRAFTERRKSETEIKQTDRDHRLEQANAFQKQAESIRQKIKENTRSHEQLVKRREEIEERMRLA